MRKLWLAVKHDYLKNVRQKGFLLALFSLPLFIGLSVGLGYLMRSQTQRSDSIGFVDHSGVLDDAVSFNQISERDRINIIQVASEVEAQELIKNRDLQAYFVIPQDYPQNKNIDLNFIDEPGENATRDFYDFLQLNLISHYPQEIQKRVSVGTNTIIRTPDGLREFPDNNPTLNMFLPAIIGIAFIMLLLISSGYLMSGFMEEKSNRTIELIFTSMSPAQLVGSKLTTMIAIGITMFATWVAVSVIALFIGANILDLQWMREISINWRDVSNILLIALPSYIFAAALMLGIGLFLGNSQESESIGPIFFMVAFIPLWFMIPITRDINGPIAITLSILPISAVLTIGIRSIFIAIPGWQIVLSIFTQLVLVVGALWLATKTFRLGMLRSGNKIRWKELIPMIGNKMGEERS
jgi:ABC-2 type transport system permease protein